MILVRQGNVVITVYRYLTCVKLFLKGTMKSAGNWMSIEGGLANTWAGVEEMSTKLTRVEIRKS